MSCTVVVVRTEVDRLDPSHPVFGSLLDRGSYGRVDLPGAEVLELVERALPAAEVVEEAELGNDPAAARAGLERLAERGPTALVALGAASALVAVAGPPLPSMGPVAAIDAATLERSLRYVAGREDGVDGTIFAEPVASDEDEELRLRERLIQLYGE
jgi:hypothetical protein